MAAVLVSNHVCWSQSFFSSKPLLTKVLPWQQPCLLWIVNYFQWCPIYYTKSQKISSAYCKLFQHIKEKLVGGGGDIVSLAWIGLSIIW